jgi:hypothetical protein
MNRFKKTILLITPIIFLLSLLFFSCNQDNKTSNGKASRLSSEFYKGYLQNLLQNKTNKDDSIENLKNYIFSEKINFSEKKQILDSVMFSLCTNNILPLKQGMPNTEIIHFEYEHGDSIIQKLINESQNIIPQGFINCVKNHLPVYLRITEDGVINHPGGNKFADGGLTREDVGAAWNQGNYGAYSEPSSYNYDFLYLDKRYDLTDAKFKGSIFLGGSYESGSGIYGQEWFSCINIGHCKNGSILFSPPYKDIIYDSILKVYSKKDFIVDSELLQYNINNLAQYIFKSNLDTNIILYQNSSSKFVFYNSIKTWKNYYDPNGWNVFFQGFKTAIIKDNESQLLLLSNKTLADMSAKDWIKSVKAGSGFSTLQNSINAAIVESEGVNKKTIDFAYTNNCYLEFRLTKSGWRLFNVVYYAD